MRVALAEAQWGCPLPVLDLLALRPACLDSLEATIKVGGGAFVAPLSPVSLHLRLCSQGDTSCSGRATCADNPPPPPPPSSLPSRSLRENWNGATQRAPTLR